MVLKTLIACDYATDTVADLIAWLHTFPADTPVLSAKVMLWKDRVVRDCVLNNTDAYVEQQKLALAELAEARRELLEKGYLEEDV